MLSERFRLSESPRRSYIGMAVAIFAVLFNFFLALGLSKRKARMAALNEMGVTPNSPEAREIVREAEKASGHNTHRI